MKKLIISLGLIIISIIIFNSYKPIVIKYLFGNATILEPVKNFSVSINYKLYKNVLYENDNSLILFLENESINTDYSIISIDYENNFIGYNCSSKDCNDTFLGNLFQSDMGKMFTLFNDSAKAPSFNTELKVEEKIIDFYIPKKGNDKLHIQLNRRD